MEAYSSFAQVYDLFMDNVPYDEWAKYIREQLVENGIEDGIIVDLGCGTGRLARIIKEFGYDVIGIDNSIEMLNIANEAEQDILYLCQDMRELELAGSVKAIYSACDCLNYIMYKEELFEVFSNVSQFLEKDGLFIFDVNSRYKYEVEMDEYTFAENREEGSFIWENFWDSDEDINEYDLTLFIKESDGRYQKYSETHYQRCYDIEVLEELLAKTGFEIIGEYEGYTNHKIKKDSEKYTIIAKKI